MTDPMSNPRPQPIKQVATTIQAATVSGVSALIERVATATLGSGEQSSPAMLSAMESVLSLLDAKAQRNPALQATLAKVREATGLIKTPKETTNANPL
jgi:hypothetical protein